jgi:hypothetical protein
VRATWASSGVYYHKSIIRCPYLRLMVMNELLALFLDENRTRSVPSPGSEGEGGRGEGEGEGAVGGKERKCSNDNCERDDLLATGRFVSNISRVESIYLYIA